MAAKDKNGNAFEEGKKVRVVSSGKHRVNPENGLPYEAKGHWGGDNPEGTYEGTIVGVHEDGPHVQVGEGAKAHRTTPLAAECEVLG